MGKHARKTPYKKLLKEERAKTKLKVSHKTILLKGQNLTSTNFKVKKVVVKNQLKVHVGEIVSKNNLNVKELISRLHHHNAPLRCNALINLTEMVAVHHDAVLYAHLPALVHAASNFILDREQDVRSEAIKLLSNILSKTKSDKLTELFVAIVKHLACAMSHINADIRACSLTVLDTLIDKQPNLTARFCQPVILPAFIDLISTKFADSDRKLTIQYNDNMTSNTWRIKVLARLYSLLKAIVRVQNDQHAAHNDEEYVKKVKWSDEDNIYASLYNCSFDTTRTLDLFLMQSEKESKQGDQKEEIQNYAQVLVPLLLNIFMEVAPQKMKNGRAGKCVLLELESGKNNQQKSVTIIEDNA